MTQNKKNRINFNLKALTYRWFIGCAETTKEENNVKPGRCEGDAFLGRKYREERKP